jgi:hypothetical protein
MRRTNRRREAETLESFRPRYEISYGRLKPTNLGRPAPLCPWCERAFTPKRTGGRPQRFRRDGCRRAFERELRAWARDQITAGDVTPAQLQRAPSLGAPTLGGRRQVAESRRHRMGAKPRLVLGHTRDQCWARSGTGPGCRPIGRGPQGKSRSPPSGGLDLLEWFSERDWTRRNPGHAPEGKLGSAEPGACRLPGLPRG